MNAVDMYNKLRLEAGLVTKEELKKELEDHELSVKGSSKDLTEAQEQAMIKEYYELNPVQDEDYNYSDLTGYMYNYDDAKVISQDEMQSLMDQMTEGFVKGSLGQDYCEEKDGE